MSTFTTPIALHTSKIQEEQIYDFSRKVVFSPEITGNRSLRCCLVSGNSGAESMSHRHPGDEMVFTLHGESVNFFNNRQVSITQHQSLAVPPETKHTTKIMSSAGWKGISFYCDECPLIRNGKKTEQIKSASVQPVVNRDKTIGEVGSGRLQKKVLLSPGKGDTQFLELFLLRFKGSGRDKTQLPRSTYDGETIYFTLSGNFLLSYEDDILSLTSGTAIVIPAMLSHGLKCNSSNKGLIVAASCSCCPLLQTSL